jgi:hypothetical protein
MNADKAGASKAQNYALDFQARLAEVDQEAQLQTSRPKVVQALGTMNIIECSDRLQFNEHRILNQQIDSVLANDDTVVPDNDSALLRNDEPRLAKFMRERIFINLLEKSGPERVGDGERASDDTLGKSVHYGIICVHLRSSAVPFSFFGLSQPKLANPLTHRRSRHVGSQP